LNEERDLHMAEQGKYSVEGTGLECIEAKISSCTSNPPLMDCKILGYENIFLVTQ